VSERRPYRPTYRVAKALAVLAAELASKPDGLRFDDARARIEAASGASSDRSFRRYLRALGDVFDGEVLPRLVVDARLEVLRLEGRREDP
jgi:hypothetical protein